MAVLNDPNVSANIARVGDVSAKGLHIISKPIDAGALGHYSYGGFTGVISAGLAANSEIFQFRWTNGSNFAIIRQIRISASVSTTYFSVNTPANIDLVKSSNWTSAGTGGTAINPSGLLKRRTSMGNSLVGSGDMRIATTTGLGAGTKTLETLALASLSASAPTAASSTIILPGTILYQAQISDGEYPIVLNQSEGLSIRVVAIPAVGTWQCSINIEWVEVAAY